MTSCELLSLPAGAPVRGSADVRHGGRTGDGGPADLHADGDGRRQRRFQLRHFLLHPGRRAVQGSKGPRHHQ